jgi:hypothetical protein
MAGVHAEIKGISDKNTAQGRHVPRGIALTLIGAISTALLLKRHRMVLRSHCVVSIDDADLEDLRMKAMGSCEKRARNCKVTLLLAP